MQIVRVFARVCPTYMDTMTWMQCHWLIMEWMIDWSNDVHSSSKCVWSSSVSYFVVHYFHHKIINGIIVLNHVAPSVKLMM